MRIKLDWKIGGLLPLREQTVFYVSNGSLSSRPQGSTARLGQERHQLCRQLALVAVGTEKALESIRCDLDDLLGKARVKRMLAIASIQTLGACAIRAEFRFAVDEWERSGLDELVRHRCHEKGLQYLRLDAR